MIRYVFNLFLVKPKCCKFVLGQGTNDRSYKSYVAINTNMFEYNFCFFFLISPCVFLYNLPLLCHTLLQLHGYSFEMFLILIAKARFMLLLPFLFLLLYCCGVVHFGICHQIHIPIHI